MKGFNDVFGNTWEWCEDHFNGLPGFKTSYMYDDFSTPCFDGRHNIIMGGSWISTGDEASRYARFM
jgi:formylglycine-generating enzyme required for sulfatase activity